jgi:hypothetical protein
MPKIDVTDVPELGGWVTIQRAADALSLTRQAVSKKVREGRVPMTELRRLSYGPGSQNDLLLLSVKWVREEIERRSGMAAERRAKLDEEANAMPVIDHVDDEKLNLLG